jgi:beta-hydroxylase
MFYSVDQFPFVRMLEVNWSTIRDEYSRLAASDFMEWPERHLYNKGWEVFGLYAFGRKIEQNCKLCPETTRTIESIPGMVTAGFSQMAPGTHIAPHVGYTSAVLRCHLGIIVPEDCALRVGSETRTWQAGKCLIFDDTVEHEAWNRSDKHRTVLLLDIKRPDRESQIAVPTSVAGSVEKLTTSSQEASV